MNRLGFILALVGSLGSLHAEDARTHILTPAGAARVFYIAGSQALLLGDPAETGRLVLLERLHQQFSADAKAKKPASPEAWREYFLHVVSTYNKQVPLKSPADNADLRSASIRNGWVAAFTHGPKRELLQSNDSTGRVFSIAPNASVADLFAFSSRRLKEVEALSIADDEYKYSVTSAFEEPSPGALPQTNVRSVIPRIAKSGETSDRITMLAASQVAKVANRVSADGSVTLELNSLLDSFAALHTAYLKVIDAEFAQRSQPMSTIGNSLLGRRQASAYLGGALFLSSLISDFDPATANTCVHIAENTAVLAENICRLSAKTELGFYKRLVEQVSRIAVAVRSDTKAERRVTQQLQGLLLTFSTAFNATLRSPERINGSWSKPVNDLAAAVGASNYALATTLAKQVISLIEGQQFSPGTEPSRLALQFCFDNRSALESRDISYCLSLFDTQLSGGYAQSAEEFSKRTSLSEHLKENLAAQAGKQESLEIDELALLAVHFSGQKSFKPIRVRSMTRSADELYRFASAHPEGGHHNSPDWIRTIERAKATSLVYNAQFADHLSASRRAAADPTERGQSILYRLIDEYHSVLAQARAEASNYWSAKQSSLAHNRSLETPFLDQAIPEIENPQLEMTLCPNVRTTAMNRIPPLPVPPEIYLQVGSEHKVAVHQGMGKLRACYEAVEWIPTRETLTVSIPTSLALALKSEPRTEMNRSVYKALPQAIRSRIQLERLNRFGRLGVTVRIDFVMSTGTSSTLSRRRVETAKENEAPYEGYRLINVDRTAGERGELVEGYVAINAPDRTRLDEELVRVWTLPEAQGGLMSKVARPNSEVLSENDRKQTRDLMGRLLEQQRRVLRSQLATHMGQALLKEPTFQDRIAYLEVLRDRIEAFAHLALPHSWTESGDLRGRFHGTEQLIDRALVKLMVEFRGYDTDPSGPMYRDWEERLKAFEVSLATALASEPTSKHPALVGTERTLEILESWAHRDVEPISIQSAFQELSKDVDTFIATGK